MCCLARFSSGKAAFGPKEMFAGTEHIAWLHAIALNFEIVRHDTALLSRGYTWSSTGAT